MTSLSHFCCQRCKYLTLLFGYLIAFRYEIYAFGGIWVTWGQGLDEIVDIYRSTIGHKFDALLLNSKLRRFKNISRLLYYVFSLWWRFQKFLSWKFQTNGATQLKILYL